MLPVLPSLSLFLIRVNTYNNKVTRYLMSLSCPAVLFVLVYPMIELTTISDETFRCTSHFTLFLSTEPNAVMDSINTIDSSETNKRPPDILNETERTIETRSKQMKYYDKLKRKFPNKFLVLAEKKRLNSSVGHKIQSDGSHSKKKEERRTRRSQARKDQRQRKKVSEFNNAIVQQLDARQPPLTINWRDDLQRMLSPLSTFAHTNEPSQPIVDGKPVADAVNRSLIPSIWSVEKVDGKPAASSVYRTPPIPTVWSVEEVDGKPAASSDYQTSPIPTVWSVEEVDGKPAASSVYRTSPIPTVWSVEDDDSDTNRTELPLYSVCATPDVTERHVTSTRTGNGHSIASAEGQHVLAAIMDAISIGNNGLSKSEKILATFDKVTGSEAEKKLQRYRFSTLKLAVGMENCKITGTLTGNDDYSLLKKGEMLTGDIINAYRCILMKRECDRNKQKHAPWFPSWIFSTVFVQRLLQEGSARCGYNYGLVDSEGGKVNGTKRRDKSCGIQCAIIRSKCF